MLERGVGYLSNRAEEAWLMARITLGSFSQRVNDEPHPQARDRSFPVPGQVHVRAAMVARNAHRGGGGEEEYRGG